MSDAVQSLDFSDKLWSVRGIPNDVRAIAAREARAAGVPIGQWVSHVIRLHVWREQRPSIDAPEPRKVEAKHLIYIHVDPKTRELLYVGMSGGGMRPNDFAGRAQKHRDKLRGLLASGCRRGEIRHIVARGLTLDAAVRMERELIAKLKPPLNGPRLWAA